MCNCCTLSLTAHSSGRCCIPTENHSIAGIPRENHSIAGISRENHGIAGIPRENHGIAGIPRENHSIAGIPRENHSIAGSFAAQEGQIGWLQKELKQRTKESSWESHLSLGHLHIEHAYVLSVCCQSPTAVNRGGAMTTCHLCRACQLLCTGENIRGILEATAALEKSVLTANFRYPSTQLCLLVQVYANQHGRDSFRKKQSFWEPSLEHDKVIHWHISRLTTFKFVRIELDQLENP